MACGQRPTLHVSGLFDAFPVRADGGETTVVHQDINFNINAMDGRSVSQVLREQAPIIAQIVGDAAQEGRGFRRMLRGR